MRPRIAIAGDALTAPAKSINLNHADMAPNMIKNALIKVGGAPFIVPFPETPDDVQPLVAEYVTMLDGLVLPGGPDVDPTFYGEEPNPGMGAAIYPEDVFELALVRATVASGKPIFAMCRGMQVLNVALGGTLYQDLGNDDPACRIRHEQAASGEYPTHHVNMVPGSHLAGLIGEHAYVNSRHHQAVHQLGDGLVVTATAPDGVVEGIESATSHQLLGVQWHPENLWVNDPTQLKLFADLVQKTQYTKPTQ